MVVKENHILELSNLTKKLGDQILVDNLSFSLRKGEIYGFLGPNGSGKTTTLRMISGLVFPTSGEIKVHGYSVDKEQQQANSYIGSIIENPAFYLNLTAEQNLKLSGALSDLKICSERINEVLDIVKLKEVKKQKVKTFSLGMKQRLGLANALLCQPALILLDEPTNGVDPVGLREMKRLIKHLAKEEQITFLISSHMLREIEDLCDRAAIIQNGRLIENGKVSALLKKYKADNLEDVFFCAVEEAEK